MTDLYARSSSLSRVRLESTDNKRRAAPYLHHACGDGDTPLEQIR